MSELSRNDYLAAIEREGRALAAAGDGDLAAPVPACPGWTVESVLGHVGRVHRLVAETIERRATEAISFREVARPPEGDAVRAYYAEGLATVLATLRAVGADTPVWNWGPDHTAAFYYRRMAHETAVHRLDAESALGEVTPCDAELATDGIEEFYDTVLPSFVVRSNPVLPAGSLHLHRSDGAGEWMIQTVDGKVVVTHEHGKGDAAVRGPASDLFAFVWNRGTAGTLSVFGDEAVARAWSALAP